MLEKVDTEHKLTVEFIRSILNAVHQEGASVNTVYSNIFDLKNGIIYLYHSHQFDEVVQINVSSELAKAPLKNRIEDLFSQKTIDTAKRQNFEYQKKIIVWKRIAWIWIFISVVSALLLIWDFTHKTEAPWRIQIAWVMVTILYGPIGLLTYIVTYRQPQRLVNIKTKMTNWRQALRETLFSVVGPSFGLSLAFASFYTIQSFNESTIWSVAFRLYGLPLLVGLFFFRTPLIEYFLESQYWRAVLRICVAEVILQNFILSGMLPVISVLIIFCEKNMGLREPSNVLFWGTIHIGAIAGALTVFPCTYFIACYRTSLPESNLFTYQKNHQIRKSSESITLRNSWILLLLSFIIIGCSLFMLFSFL